MPGAELHDELLKAFDAATHSSELRNRIPGRLGRPDGVIEAPREGYVYVRSGPEGNEGVLVAWNGGVPLQYNLPVWMKLEFGHHVIKGVATSGPANSWMQTPTWVQMNQVVPLRGYVSSGMTVAVNEGLVSNGDEFLHYPGGTIDLTSYIPASGTVYATVYLDPDTETLGVVTTDVLSSTVGPGGFTLPSEIDVLLEAAPEGTYPIVGARLTSTTTSLTGDDLIDLRLIFNTMGESAHDHSIDDLSDVDTSTAAPAEGDTLVWDGANWVPGDATATVEAVRWEPLTNGVVSSPELVFADGNVIMVLVTS